MSMAYKWGTFQYSVPAEKVGREFEKLEKKHGEITNEIVVEAARSEKSVLHNMFEWNDEIAGQKYRLIQAQQITCSLSYVGEDKQVHRAFMNVTTKAPTVKGTFWNVNRAMTDENARMIILKNAASELFAFQKKYERINELAEVFAAIDHLKGGE